MISNAKRRDLHVAKRRAWNVENERKEQGEIAPVTGKRKGVLVARRLDLLALAAGHGRDAHRPLEPRDAKVRFLGERGDDRPGVHIAVDHALRMQKLKRFDQAAGIRPQYLSRAGLPGLSEQVGFPSGVEKGFQGAALAGIKDNVKAFIVLAARGHVHK